MNSPRDRRLINHRSVDRPRDVVSTVGLWERLSVHGGSQGARADRQTVIRHIACELERLLNTRQSPLTMVANVQLSGHSMDHGTNQTPVQRSVLAYGVREVIGLSPHSTRDQAVLRHRIEQAILMFEPRLLQVRVYIDEESLSPRILKFKINGVLKTRATRFDVRFAARLDLASQSVRVEETVV